jgi:hypothetical protein
MEDNPKVDLCFSVTGKNVPVDHGFDLYRRLYIRYAKPTLYLNCGLRLICLKVSTRNYLSTPSIKVSVLRS